VIAELRKLHNGEIHYLYFSTKHYWDDVVNGADVERECNKNCRSEDCLQNFGQEMCVWKRMV
jgi:hypothetical protein